MATNKIQTGLRLDEELYEKLRVLAKEDGRSLNNLCEYVLKAYVDQHWGTKIGPPQFGED